VPQAPFDDTKWDWIFYRGSKLSTYIPFRNKWNQPQYWQWSTARTVDHLKTTVKSWTPKRIDKGIQVTDSHWFIMVDASSGDDVAALAAQWSPTGNSAAERGVVKTCWRVKRYTQMYCSSVSRRYTTHLRQCKYVYYIWNKWNNSNIISISKVLGIFR
jgi:hypothetical protein